MRGPGGTAEPGLPDARTRLGLEPGWDRLRRSGEPAARRRNRSLRRRRRKMEKLLLVVAGGALGTGCRYLLSSYVYAHLSKPTFPWANLLVNVSGSFAIGVLTQLFDAR